MQKFTVTSQFTDIETGKTKLVGDAFESDDQNRVDLLLKNKVIGLKKAPAKKEEKPSKKAPAKK